MPTHPPSPADIPVLRFERIDSTSLHARRLFDSGELPITPLLLLADEQSGGVGRFGRPWQSPRGGLWCTLAWPLDSGPEGDNVIDGLGLRVGVAALRVIRETLEHAQGRGSVQLKWPNDIYIDGRKISGLLCELLHRSVGAPPRRCILVGVGVNANFRTDALQPDLRMTATTILEHTGAPADLEALRTRLLLALIHALTSHALPAPVLAEARANLFGLQQPATITLPDGRIIRGTLTGLDDRGLAILSTDQGPFHAPPGAMIASL